MIALTSIAGLEIVSEFRALWVFLSRGFLDRRVAILDNHLHLERLVPLGESHLRFAIAEYMRHYHLERNHQGLANALIYGSTPSCPQIRRRDSPMNSRRYGAWKGLPRASNLAS